ncbi:MAG TPA: globin domain-containing protein [Propionibacteriaceae bacterium]
MSNVDEIDNVVPLLEQLGRDHRRFSVITEHYTAVGPSLLATLQHFLGRLWMPDLADTWAQAYGLVAKVMAAAAEQHEEVAPASWEADVVRGRTALCRGCHDSGGPPGAVPAPRRPIPSR